MALEITSRAKFNTAFPVPTSSDLHVLGDLLIPAEVMELLKPDTHLLLVPHKNLHGVPWAALQPGDMSKPLVCICTPGIISSLRGLFNIWKRITVRHFGSGRNGLVVGLSDFGGSRPELPLVREEIHALRQELGPGGFVLSEGEATWQNLRSLCSIGRRNRRQPGLSRFDWLHIASHAFIDTQSGRSSGIALADGDVWLDEFMDLAPLPALVTLSACNSVYSYIYRGDEHVGLPTTCLAAGANCVVGSLWPVLDKPAADFSASFYNNYFEGQAPAYAVARIQRQMIDNKEPMNNWAGFVCIGAP